MDKQAEHDEARRGGVAQMMAAATLTRDSLSDRRMAALAVAETWLARQEDPFARDNLLATMALALGAAMLHASCDCGSDECLAEMKAAMQQVGGMVAGGHPAAMARIFGEGGC